MKPSFRKAGNPASHTSTLAALLLSATALAGCATTQKPPEISYDDATPAVQTVEADELPDADYPFILNTGRILYHWHGGTITRRVPGLLELSPRLEVAINPVDARRLGLADGDPVRVSSRRGELTARAKLDDGLRPGAIFVPFVKLEESAANFLTNAALDPASKIPEYKVSAVRIERVGPDEPVVIEADVGQVRQVFLNLLLNAEQAMPEGGTLTIQAERDEWLRFYDALADNIIKPTIAPASDPRVTTLPFFGFDPALVTPAAKAPVTIKEEAPAECLRCGKAFGTRSAIDRVVAKLGGHWMAKDDTLARRLNLCADCRAIEQSESTLDPYAGAPRPFPRHTEEDLARDDRPPDDKKKH